MSEERHVRIVIRKGWDSDKCYLKFETDELCVEVDTPFDNEYEAIAALAETVEKGVRR